MKSGNFDGDKLAEALLLYGVTDRAWTGRQSLYRQVEEALRGGVTMVQLREKDTDEGKFLREAVEMGDLCHEYGVPLIINDNVEIAMKSGADGVHLGQEDMPADAARRILGENMIIGVSAHSAAEAVYAEKAGADYLGAGAAFATGTKKDASVISRETLTEICSAVKIPVVAIGGITEGNMLQLRGTGVKGVAMVSAVFGAEDIRKACADLRELAERMVKE